MPSPKTRVVCLKVTRQCTTEYYAELTDEQIKQLTERCVDQRQFDEPPHKVLVDSNVANWFGHFNKANTGNSFYGLATKVELKVLRANDCFARIFRKKWATQEVQS